MGLLLTRKKLKIAKKGHKLLKEKRDVLVMEFFSLLKGIKELRKEIAEKMIKAQNSLYAAQAVEGQQNIERTALALSTGVDIQMSTRNLMGVELPTVDKIDMNETWFGYYDTTVELDNAITKYRELFPTLMKLVERQLALTHLAEEIKKTKRRVNSLEYLTIPGLENIRKAIAFKLEEQERENFSRLKMIKKIQEREHAES